MGLEGAWFETLAHLDEAIMDVSDQERMKLGSDVV